MRGQQNIEILHLLHIQIFWAYTVMSSPVSDQQSPLYTTHDIPRDQGLGSSWAS